VKTRFSPLVKLKKSTMRKSEQFVQQANTNLNNASTALKLSYSSLEDVNPPISGTMNEMLASRTLLESQRGIINFASNQVNQAKKQLKLDMIEYEKFNYLELQEIEKEIKKRKIKEVKDLDEIALMTYKGRDIL